MKTIKSYSPVLSVFSLIVILSMISPQTSSTEIPGMMMEGFNFFVEGLSFPTVLLFFFVEGLGYSIALFYFYNRFIRRGRRFSVDLFQNFETPVIDKGYNEKVAEGVRRTGSMLRKMHRGELTTYLLWAVLGLLIIIAGIVLT
ncbi:hypothetical protein AKJ45_00745 [candidate division MSBL1 archaeon SCGC-AAA261F19]|uniref:Uncharacterized protein n=1 Tax=candidate division MSBL1 archaeon SCGC-AAA261F19 TaxID=1698275 RepID=A0A133VBB1_9EURY|nr:hypothetical protein AKJ45_00745 [candidate division MSBL1 archaeon SCGC-AAA261F19]